MRTSKNKTQFLHLQRCKKQQRIDACNYFGQNYDNIKHTKLSNVLLDRYLQELEN